MALSQLIRIPITRHAAAAPNGTKALMGLMHKYGMTPTMETRFERDHNRTLVVRRDDNTVEPVPAMDWVNDLFYTSECTIGTPGLKFNLIFDTGSADLWTWSTRLPESILAEGRQAGTTIFDPAQSSTYKELDGYKWRIRYGDQSAAGGTVGTDNIQIGNIMVKNQTIQLADRISESLVHSQGAHGLLGLAFGSLNTVTPLAAKTPLENMITQKDIPVGQSLFTAYIGSYKDVNDADKGQSFFTFGGIDWEVVKSTGQEITYVPVDTYRGFWQFNSPSFAINGHVIRTADNTAIADTGTTLMLVSDDACRAIYNTIPGAIYSKDASAWLIPNGIPLEQLPFVSFALGDKQMVIEKEHLLYAPSDSPIPGMTFGGIQSRGSLPFDIWGDTMLKCIYAIFDAGNMQFGAVQRVDLTQTTPV
ncbi:uncharacterized protein A1O9_00691 [Exophiala aquamarina CBS 119918]|uniref:Peptidase A1 domain-containing protein n=1 Tax=Exophiala aquamarina CBS 119918 TaxID=1182545 RepID=A0A072PTR1_9EURO|nr:uncharacterized protein A1O9_00691 [Exophiala aquamarina CBS 119918]KEF62718.1 hypothetical protein A1O9_00691 [Exophiala aquamarina CBS 119918]